MPLPSGNWKANINGWEDVLSITATNAQTSLVTCSLGGVNGEGFWNEDAQRLTLSFVIGTGNVSSNLIPDLTTAVFEGHLFRTPPQAPAGQDVVATLTGSFLVTAHSIPTTPVNWPIPNRDRERFGWFATITEIH